MKALVWTAPETMEYRETPEAAPSAGEVLIQVEAVGICGSEIEGYLGHNSLRVPPLVMGHEFCGRIVKLGPGAPEHLAEGQKVVVNPLTSCGTCISCRKGHTQLCASRRIVGIHRPGAFGERVAVPASGVVPVPEPLDAYRAALAEPLACSLRATRRAMARHFSPNVLVFGAGGIGLLCAQVAKLLGAERVTIADTQEERLQIARRHGADEVVNPAATDVSSFLAERLGDKGVDVVLDAAGFQPTRASALSIVNPGGTVMNIGLGIDDTTIRVNHLIRSEIEVLGSFCYTAQDFHDAVGLLAAGRITEQGWTEVRPLSEGGEAFRDLVRGKVKQGKIFLSVNGG
ncbi:2-desacetyl-2-hydroxyethyl bacteriochlorophyllide A dehydrogenase [Paenibacillus sp. UNCCL117]|uniref:zinc-dependent alcohol dehydrogenase n=1 Tax=unclassified Paenibacillus TaxID=185978 RepID=UPI0008869838|nr:MULTISPECIES: galactitol-1-phosphate 5-dehydrogenase [unclassified Paenibacillus]SDE10319.1 2-desacetyl-2-hydroxyethyl bacteriochlorophyllide A dehydrogenase [Paenibacillus sp. cl123]SFW59736.1 2-desacetyl-2-hydroxyethyl bacteriochlorophyllide A dehydrogenase [Paenibacillus sp. UNCCL117]